MGGRNCPVCVTQMAEVGASGLATAAVGGGVSERHRPRRRQAPHRRRRRSASSRPRGCPSETAYHGRDESPRSVTTPSGWSWAGCHSQVHPNRPLSTDRMRWRWCAVSAITCQTAGSQHVDRVDLGDAGGRCGGRRTVRCFPTNPRSTVREPPEGLPESPCGDGPHTATLLRFSVDHSPRRWKQQAHAEP